ncbi:DNA circularization N-terminal domain-containing protein [Methylobacterium sp. J-030]|uniref:DNA circularization N-terminal domain-containing protein n=1 Tax=Methylobacterium sp. J-030 TaxID=2836627 RepID=UPI001FB8DC5F|nr:DNA circularization N-terminal domain-containing protein [Methylobacterium sp. J-030]MCJ2067749.1 DNA circularization N-terminal domain-containing protein [Methylobacterium sp. J-030]
MPIAPWRLQLRSASFRGVGFHVEVGALAGGRRIALHEFPKRDTPYAEDMGRRARRFPVTGYIVDEDYIPQRDALIAALEAGGGGTLVHPTLGTFRVACDGFSAIERRDKGGYVEFEMTFVEAGSLSAASMSATTDTSGAVNTAADGAGQTSASTLDGSLDAYDTPGFNASDVQNIEVGQLPGATLNDFTLPGFEGSDIDNAGIGQLQSGDLTNGTASATQTDGSASAPTAASPGAPGTATPEILSI